MKIYAFEVRDDEREYFKELSQIPGIELELHSEGLTRTNISKLESGCGVTVLGMYNYRRPVERCVLFIDRKIRQCKMERAIWCF